MTRRGNATHASTFRYDRWQGVAWMRRRKELAGVGRHDTRHRQRDVPERNTAGSFSAWARRLDLCSGRRGFFGGIGRRPRSEPSFSHEEAPGPHANFRTVRVFQQSVTVSREATAPPLISGEVVSGAARAGGQWLRLNDGSLYQCRTSRHVPTETRMF